MVKIIYLCDWRPIVTNSEKPMFVLCILEFYDCYCNFIIVPGYKNSIKFTVVITITLLQCLIFILGLRFKVKKLRINYRRNDLKDKKPEE